MSEIARRAGSEKDVERAGQRSNVAMWSHELRGAGLLVRVILA